MLHLGGTEFKGNRTMAFFGRKLIAMLEVSESMQSHKRDVTNWKAITAEFRGADYVELGQVFLTALGPLYTVYLGPFLRDQRDATIVEPVESRPS